MVSSTDHFKYWLIRAVRVGHKIKRGEFWRWHVDIFFIFYDMFRKFCFEYLHLFMCLPAFYPFFISSILLYSSICHFVLLLLPLVPPPHTHTHTWTRTCTHTHTDTHTHTLACTCTHQHVHMHAHTHICIYTLYTYLHAHTHMHTHTHTHN